MDRLAGLDLFIRVVETGSFNKAAEDLGIAQSTATKAVAAIEERLGARLLQRSTRGIAPTEVGALYYEKCKRISRDVEEAENLATLLRIAVGHVGLALLFEEHSRRVSSFIIRVCGCGAAIAVAVAMTVPVGPRPKSGTLFAAWVRDKATPFRARAEIVNNAGLGAIEGRRRRAITASL